MRTRPYSSDPITVKHEKCPTEPCCRSCCPVFDRPGDRRIAGEDGCKASARRKLGFRPVYPNFLPFSPSSCQVWNEALNAINFQRAIRVARAWSLFNGHIKVLTSTKIEKKNPRIFSPLTLGRNNFCLHDQIFSWKKNVFVSNWKWVLTCDKSTISWNPREQKRDWQVEYKQQRCASTLIDGFQGQQSCLTREMGASWDMLVIDHPSSASPRLSIFFHSKLLYTCETRGISQPRQAIWKFFLSTPAGWV